jgi:hypothetical protein
VCDNVGLGKPVDLRYFEASRLQVVRNALISEERVYAKPGGFGYGEGGDNRRDLVGRDDRGEAFEESSRETVDFPAGRPILWGSS